MTFITGTAPSGGEKRGEKRGEILDGLRNSVFREGIRSIYFSTPFFTMRVWGVGEMGGRVGGVA